MYCRGVPLRSPWFVALSIFQGSHDAAGGVDEPAPGALGHVCCWREVCGGDFLAAGTRGAVEDGAAQVVGGVSGEEGIG